MKANFLHTLRKLFEQCEHELGFRLVVAMDAGSHAWGYATPNSDHDIKFVYVQLPWRRGVANTDDTQRVQTEVDGFRFDLQGFELRKAFGMCARSDASLQEVLSSKLIYGRDYGIEQLRAVIDHYANPPACYDAFLSQVHRNLFPKRSNKFTAKGLIHALRYALICEELRDRGHIVPCLADRNDMHNYSRFGSTEVVQAYVRWLIANPDATPEVLMQHPDTRSLYKFFEQLDKHRMEPIQRIHDLSFADSQFQDVCEFHFQYLGSERPVKWVDHQHTSIC